ncbi:MAG TPA: diguanylate cyclase, partial [Methylothermaceae bacterium]|nr:diguanylate cyclase [Methylothermaceae bacterium]
MAELYAFQSPKSRSMTAMLTPEQANHLLRLQRDVLAEVVQNGDGQKALDLLCRTAESLLPNSAASVMVFDPGRQGLQVKAAPSVPEEAVKALNGLKPGERAGSCGTAVFKGEPQFVCDTTIDPRWAGEAFQWFVKTFDLMACWSVPIHRGSEVIGSMALSSFEKRRPSEFHRMLLETCAHLAGIILEREREQQKLWDLAHYDHLTGLPNRRLFHLMLDRAIQRARDHDGRLALLFIDLDNFKDINDNFGHNTGDLVLQRVAENIRHDLRAENVIARLGGDEFVVLLEDIETQDQIHQMADRLMAAIKTPVHVDGNDYRLSASIGISLFPEDGADLQSLHKHADLAMYEAKARGRGRYIRYRPDLSRKLQMRVRLVDDLREALAERRLTLAFQPQVAAATGRLSGVEALVRWHHPRMGWIAPPSFVPLAEQCGLIDALGNWVLEAACRQCLAWWRQGLPGFDLAVNVSVLQLHGGFA